MIGHRDDNISVFLSTRIWYLVGIFIYLYIYKVPTTETYKSYNSGIPDCLSGLSAYFHYTIDLSPCHISLLRLAYWLRYNYLYDEWWVNYLHDDFSQEPTQIIATANHTVSHKTSSICPIHFHARPSKCGSESSRIFRHRSVVDDNAPIDDSCMDHDRTSFEGKSHSRFW